MRMAVLLLVAVVVSATRVGATTYDVGPGQPLANVGDVPWESLMPGDTVQIHWRATPYREKWVISRAGTAAQPITVRGIPDGSGNLPVISGDGATTRTTTTPPPSALCSSTTASGRSAPAATATP
jgi:hypothetical protein